MANGVRIEGLKELTSKISQMPVKVQKAVDNELSAGAFKIAKDAKGRAPVYEGRLKQAITADTNTPNHKEVVCNVYYAPYMEFGTGRKVQIPSGLEAIAAQFKNQPKRGGFDEMVASIAEWLRITGKGDPKNARFVAIMILKNGLKARPFFFPAYDANKDKIKENVRRAIGG